MSNWRVLVHPCPFDPNERESVVRHALKLEGRSLRETIAATVPAEQQAKVIAETERFAAAGNKGGLGSALEIGHFYYSPNSDSSPDFPWGDLKCTGLLPHRAHGLVPKERLVITMIDYFGLPAESFLTSQALKKLRQLLLVFYVYERGRDGLDLKVDLVSLWSPAPDDLRLIQEDWEVIRDLVCQGRAHDLGEGLTKVLGACTKSSDSFTRVKQPFSEETAKPRAFSLKRAFLQEAYLRLKAARSAQLVPDKIQLVGLDDFLRSSGTFEEFVRQRFGPHVGAPLNEVCSRLGLDWNKFQGKGRFARAAGAIINALLAGLENVPATKIAQFRKVGLVVRTVRLKPTNMPAEDVSLPTFDYLELSEEEDWEQSELYSLLTSRFLFVFLRAEAESIVRLEEVRFWSMPENDLMGEAREVWERTKQLARSSAATGYPKISETRTVHVRPHAANAVPRASLPDGTKTFRRSFWLNKRYVKRVFEENRDG